MREPLEHSCKPALAQPGGSKLYATLYKRTCDKMRWEERRGEERRREEKKRVRREGLLPARCSLLLMG